MKGLVLYGSVDLTDFPFILDPGSDMGASVPDVTTVSRMLTDGDVVAGVRSGNRQMQLTVTIGANSRAEFADAETALFAEVDKPTNTLAVSFGQGDGLQMVADTFRGQITPTYDADTDWDYTRTYTLTIPALPFLRSPQPITIQPTVTSSVQLDAMDSLTGLTTENTPTLDTTTFIEGTGSVRQLFALAGEFLNEIEAGWARTVTSKDLTGCTTVAMRLLVELDVPFTAGGSVLALTDSSGRTRSVSSNATLGRGWSALGFDLTPLIEFTDLDLAHIVGWNVHVSQGVTPGVMAPPGCRIWADDLRAYPPGSGAFVNGSGNLIFNIDGAARTPLSIEVDSGNLGGILLANTPDPPPGYDPVLAAIGTIPSGSGLTATRKAVTLQRADASTYAVVLYGHITVATSVPYSASASLSGDPTSVVASCARTVLSTDPEYVAANSAGYGLWSIGELTLPPAGVDPQNTAATVTINVTAFVTGVSFEQYVKGIWLVPLVAETVTVFLPGSGHVDNMYLDAPTPSQQVGAVRGGSARSSAYDLGAGRVGQAVVNAETGFNHVLVALLPYSSLPTATPGVTALTASYFSRWLTERPV